MKVFYLAQENFGCVVYGSFEMITGNTIEEVTEWLRQKKIN